MKTHSLFSIFLLLFVLLTGCSSGGGGSLLPQGTGNAYEAVVVLDRNLWNSKAGSAIRDELRASIPGLPQPEVAFKISEVYPQVFNGLLRYAKNIMVVNIDPASFTMVSLKYDQNLWAQNQMILSLNAPDEDSVVEYLNRRSGVVVDFFTRAEMNRAIRLLEKTYSSSMSNKLFDKYEIRLNLPTDMTSYRDTTDFFWVSNNANTGLTNVVVYTFPFTDSDTFTIDYLINKRDSVLKENLPGSFPNSYMATEVRGDIFYEPITLHGKYCGVMRGLWKMVGDMMGGPFVSHVRLDEKNNRIVVVEGFVYAPETEKRNLMRRIEAALYTLRLPGEYDIPISESMAANREEINTTN